MKRLFACLYLSNLFSKCVLAQDWEPVVWTTTTVTNTHYVCPCETESLSKSKGFLNDWNQWSSEDSVAPATTRNPWGSWAAESGVNSKSMVVSTSSMPGQNEGGYFPKGSGTGSTAIPSGRYTTFTETRTGSDGATVIYTMGPGDHTPLPCVPCAKPTGTTLIVTESVTQVVSPSLIASTSSTTPGNQVSATLTSSANQVSATLTSSENQVSATLTSSGSVTYATFTTSLNSPLLSGFSSLTTCRLLSTIVLSSSTTTTTPLTSTVSTTSSVIKGSPIFASSSTTTTSSYITITTPMVSSAASTVTSSMTSTTTSSISRELIVDGSFENVPANGLYAPGYSTSNWLTSYDNGSEFETNNATTGRYTQFGNQFAVLFGRANSSTYLEQILPKGPEGNTIIQYFYRVSSFRGNADFNCTLSTSSTTRFTDLLDSVTFTSVTDGLDLKNHTIVEPIYSAGRSRSLTFELTCAQSPYDYGLDLILDNISVIGPTS